MNTAVKIGLAVGALLLLVAAVWLIGFNWALLVFFLGLVAVAILLLVFVGIMRWRRKRKADPFERELAGSAGAVPSNVSEASSRARLDDLRQKFMKGIEAFKAHGKDIYSLPWYAIVGEPGSGKTEALRHSNIGFPPGLQDELQGSGGTINMDWWFTNHAIILDTAGRLMFDEAAQSSNPEWVEFLKLLRKHRPNCPINGLVLVIPADSVIRDSADQIQDKGGRIARQLDLIQRTLGVRFPVFILVTKADLINGFREFFDQLTDPQLQHQIMGWSNPNDLDEPFDPEDVVDHLYTVQERLERRRLGLLLDPVSREGAMSRRIDEVDALFAFPESIANIAPRLRRYLELIFVSGEWSSKPLFLRGIYFVSSMREGSALDADLAEALGLPVEQLPEGRIWERDRSYFLRDLFLMKMFRERGLVTRTSNTAGLKRRRGTVLIAASVILAVIWLGASWFQFRTLRRSIGEPEKFWSAASTVFTKPLAQGAYPVIVGGAIDRESADNLVYLGGETPDTTFTDDQNDSYRLAGALGAVGAQVDRTINVPLIFKPVAWFSPISSTNLSGDERQDAGRAIYEFSVLDPLVRRALNTLGGDARFEWSPEATAALTELLRLYALNDTDPSTPRPETINLQALFDFVLRPGAVATDVDQPPLQLASADVKTLQDAFNELYTTDAWPGQVIRTVAGGDAGTKLAAGIDRYVQSISGQWQGQGQGKLADAVALYQAMDKFDTAEGDLLTAYAPGEGKQARTDLDPWQQAYASLGIDSSDPGAPYQTITRLLPDLAGESFSTWYQREVEDARTSTVDRFKTMLQVLPGGEDAQPSAAGATSQVHQNLEGYRTKLESAQASVESQLKDLAGASDRIQDLEAHLLTRTRNDGPRAYEQRADIYRRIESLRSEKRSAADLADLALGLASLDKVFDEEHTRINSLRPPDKSSRANRYLDAANQVLDLIGAAGETGLTRETIANVPLPKAPQEIGRIVTDMVNKNDALAPLPAPRLAMTRWRDGTGTLDTQYHLDAAIDTLEMLHDVEATLRTQPGRTADADALHDTVGDYLDAYLHYWDSVIAAENPFQDYQGNWSTFCGELIFDYTDVNDQLLALAETREKAINAVRSLPGFGTWSTGLKGSFDRATNDVQADLNLLKVNRETLRRKCGDWAQFWTRQQTGNVEVDRQKVLDMHVADFLREALALYPVNEADHAIDYWKQLTAIGVNVLAEASDNVIVIAERTLNDLNRFPLRRLDPAAQLDRLGQNNLVERTLTTAEVYQARKALNEIRPGIIEGSNGQAAGFAAGTIGNPATRIDFPGLADALQKLRGKELAKAQLDHYQQLASLFRALPDDPKARPLACHMTYLRRTPGDNRTRVDDPLPYLRLTKVGDSAPPKVTFIRSQDDLGIEDYPGDSQLIFEFKETERGETKASLTVNGPWALFALLHKFNGTRTDDDPKVWVVEVLVPYGTGEMTMWLQLSFDTVLPALEDWPR